MQVSKFKEREMSFQLVLGHVAQHLQGNSKDKDKQALMLSVIIPKERSQSCLSLPRHNGFILHSQLTSSRQASTMVDLVDNENMAPNADSWTKRQSENSNFTVEMRTISSLKINSAVDPPLQSMLPNCEPIIPNRNKEQQKSFMKDMASAGKSSSQGIIEGQSQKSMPSWEYGHTDLNYAWRRTYIGNNRLQKSNRGLQSTVKKANEIVVKACADAGRDSFNHSNHCHQGVSSASHSSECCSHPANNEVGLTEARVSFPTRGASHRDYPGSYGSNIPSHYQQHQHRYGHVNHVYRSRNIFNRNYASNNFY